MTYSEKFKDPRWQKMRLKILKRDKFTCQNCLDTKKTLHVHHRYYLPKTEPWDYPKDSLITLCEDCHLQEKEERQRYESELLLTLRKQFLYDGLGNVACALEYMKMPLGSYLTSEFLCWLLEDEERMKALGVEFMKDYYPSETK